LAILIFNTKPHKQLNNHTKHLPKNTPNTNKTHGQNQKQKTTQMVPTTTPTKQHP